MTIWVQAVLLLLSCLSPDLQAKGTETNIQGRFIKGKTYYQLIYQFPFMVSAWNLNDFLSLLDSLIYVRAEII